MNTNNEMARVLLVQCYQAVLSALSALSRTATCLPDLDPEDLAMDVCVKMIDRFGLEEALEQRGFIQTVARNHVIDRLRQVCRRPTVSSSFDEIPTDSRNHTDKDHGQEEALFWLRSLLNSPALNERERKSLAYMCDNGLDCDRTSPDRDAVVEGLGIDQQVFYRILRNLREKARSTRNRFVLQRFAAVWTSPSPLSISQFMDCLLTTEEQTEGHCAVACSLVITLNNRFLGREHSPEVGWMAEAVLYHADCAMAGWRYLGKGPLSGSHWDHATARFYLWRSGSRGHKYDILEEFIQSIEETQEDYLPEGYSLAKVAAISFHRAGEKVAHDTLLRAWLRVCERFRDPEDVIRMSCHQRLLKEDPGLLARDGWLPPFFAC
jgi:DNA-directed RNA polymerase specialized sigma24 family protein